MVSWEAVKRSPLATDSMTPMGITRYPLLSEQLKGHIMMRLLDMLDIW